jgi:hypothetical protein
MVAMVVIGSIAAAAVAAAACYDHRAYRRGSRVGASRTDIEKREASPWPSWILTTTPDIRPGGAIPGHGRCADGRQAALDSVEPAFPAPGTLGPCMQ